MRNTKTLITSSHRPTRNTRRFIKVLSRIVPNAIKVNRGKLTFKQLALQAMDINADNILIVRNKKGNPGFIDVYKVVASTTELSKLCTLRICGYFIDDSYKGLHQVKASILKRGNILLESEIPPDLLECILKAFNISTFQNMQKMYGNNICVSIEPFKARDRTGVKVAFINCNNNSMYASISVCF
ncbi:MAG: hypothetical protein QXT53_03060 [Ignisphaera sp.]